MTLRTQLHKIEKAARTISRKKGYDDWQKRWNDARSRGFVLCSDGIERTTDEWLDYLLVKPDHPCNLETVRMLREIIDEGNTDEGEVNYDG